ncbi:MAG: type I-C CRISPR-associated protein Cas8c/Csd1 [Deltaproteobacteria bacterium]|nr:MAG: type I-C CRISPR-associated protein Cas8c/Csd1 [Deltaproteobacteria bacterium]
MLLEKLCEYSQRLEDLAPFGYDKTTIRWLINLDAEGNCLPPLIPTSSGRKNDRGKVFFAPAVMKSVNVKASLLVGNGEYVLGKPRPSSKSERVAKCHNAFVKEIRDCAKSLGSPHLQAVLRFLESLDQNTLPLPEDFDPSLNLTFQVEGIFPIDLPEVRAYWAKIQGGDQCTDIPSNLSQCLVCSTDCIPIERMPIKIKGIPGGQPSGMALVSANARAFESYGLKASLIAPLCRDCAERSAKAANALRQKEDSHLVVGSLVYLFWTLEPAGFNIASLFSHPQAEDVRALIKSARSGKPFAALDTQAFYATALSASGGRVVVRDWLETTVGQVKGHLARWFALQNLVDWDGAEGKPYGLFTLALGLIPQKGDMQRDLPPNAPRAMLKAALQGGPLPSWIMFQAIRRNRAEQQLTRPRAALIKMVLLSQQKIFQEDAMVQLDAGNQHPGYLCGRLLAVLERILMLAVSPRATLIERFYGTASTAPASVFSRLLKGAQAHLGKLRKERFGAYSALQSRLEEVMGNLSGFPKVLTLEEQGWFSLGYYHQRSWDRAQAKARKEEQVPGEEAVVEETPTEEK